MPQLVQLVWGGCVQEGPDLGVGGVRVGEGRDCRAGAVERRGPHLRAPGEGKDWPTEPPRLA